MLIPRYLATFPMLMNSSFILITINIITCIYGFYWVILMLLRPPLSKAAKRKAIRAASAAGSRIKVAIRDPSLLSMPPPAAHLCCQSCHPRPIPCAPTCPRARYTSVYKRLSEKRELLVASSHAGDRVAGPDLLPCHAHEGCVFIRRFPGVSIMAGNDMCGDALDHVSHCGQRDVAGHQPRSAVGETVACPAVAALCGEAVACPAPAALCGEAVTCPAVAARSGEAAACPPVTGAKAVSIA